MPDVTPNLELNKPLGNEFVNRQAYIKNLELIDQKATKKSDFSAHTDLPPGFVPQGMLVTKFVHRFF